ncbi:hypothetical protein EJ04DRAFT_510924 [Polyplosphaeria fusca]|uniref:Uncharacterized protein n=1 Tax=Polyplosphaeria fusca TaxID=682080 RepID=A0A9P4V1Q8_9PLEO|nr:hypothetical protein EJ04DRAFT_510924 [Polyplosphaeria fusca]
MMRFQNRSNDRLAYVDGPSSFWQREGYVKCQCIFKPESPYCDSPTRTLAPSAPEHAITPNQLTNAEAGVTDEPYRWRGLSGWSPRPSTARSRAERRRQLSSSFKSNWPRSPSPSSRTRSSLLQPSLFPTSMLSSVSNGPDLSLPLSLDQIGVLPEADKEEAVEVTPESAETMHTIQHSSRRSFTISLNPSAGNAAHRWNSPLPSLTPSPPPPPRRNSVRPGTAVSGTTQHTVDDADAEAEDLALMRMGGMADALDSYKVDDDDDDKTRPTRPVSPDRESRKGRERGRSTTRRRRRGVTMS